MIRVGDIPTHQPESLDSKFTSNLDSNEIAQFECLREAIKEALQDSNFRFAILGVGSNLNKQGRDIDLVLLTDMQPVGKSQLEKSRDKFNTTTNLLQRNSFFKQRGIQFLVPDIDPEHPNLPRTDGVIQFRPAGCREFDLIVATEGLDSIYHRENDKRPFAVLKAP